MTFKDGEPIVYVDDDGTLQRETCGPGSAPGRYWQPGGEPVSGFIPA